MQIRRLQNVMSYFVVLSEVSHVFCCVLPTVFSLLTVLVGMGVLGATPLWMEGAHDVMHAWEVPIIITSGVIVAFGWALHLISKRMDCHDTGCGHGPCDTKKKKTLNVLRIATVLFLVNTVIYISVHLPQENAKIAAVSHDDHHGHDHHH